MKKILVLMSVMAMLICVDSVYAGPIKGKGGKGKGRVGSSVNKKGRKTNNTNLRELHRKRELKLNEEHRKSAERKAATLEGRVRPASVANIGTNIERQAAAHITAETLIPTQTATQIAASQVAARLDAWKEHFLTGPQALERLRPFWEAELRLNGFKEGQIEVIKNTFAETDRWLFDVDEQGNWIRAASDEWDYTGRFAEILFRDMPKELALDEGQTKILFGKFSRLDDVFTQLNFQGFVLTHEGRVPKTNAVGEEGKLARHMRYNIDKRYPKDNPEIRAIRERALESILKKRHSQDLQPGTRGRTPVRTPQEIVTEMEAFIERNKRWPSLKSEDPAERSLRNASDRAINNAKDPKDPAILRLVELKAQGITRAAARTPQEIVTEMEAFIKQNNRYPSQHAKDPAERSLRKAFDYAIKNAKDPNNLVILRIKELKAQGVKEITAARTPQEIVTEIEAFIEENGRWPSHNAEDPAERSLRNVSDKAIIRAKDPNDPAILRLVELKTQGITRAANRTPQEIVTEIEAFIEENRRYPSQIAKDPAERSLRKASDYAIKNAKDPNDPAILRLVELKAQGITRAAARTPQEIVTEMEAFIEENGRYPSRYAEDPAERSLRKASDDAIMRAKDPKDPVIARLKELKAQLRK